MSFRSSSCRLSALSPLPRRARLRSRLVLPAALALGMAGVAASAPEAVPDYNREVRPILSENCFHCHGFDANTREAGLRLDEREAAIDFGAIVPGDADASELVARITATNPADQMPPPDSHRSLTEEQIDTLVRWIDGGAPYARHWAFEPVRKPEPPRPEDPAEAAALDDWARQDLDRFVWQRVRQQGWQPAEQTPRERWLRRVTIDLTGLPPTPDELAAFLADDEPGDAPYERVVDRLLDSPHFGERMALDWLDAARYAETFGYQADVEMHMWPWRDWVIRAFNDNLPYDRFITWQLAGDLLPDATDDQILATAFNRLHRQTNEGGSIDEEFRQEYIADRVHTSGTVFAGLTLDCARCHDHKYDPISQREYFQWAAFFASIDESGLYSHFTRATPTPTLWLWEGDQRERHDRAREEIGRLEAKLEQSRAAVAAEGTATQEEPPPGLAAPVAPPDLALTPAADNVPGGNQWIEDAGGRAAVRFTGDHEWKLDDAPVMAWFDPFTIGIDLMPDEDAAGAPRQLILHQSRAWSDSGSRGYEVVLHEGRVFFGLIHFWPGNAAAIRSKQPLPTGQWSHLTVRHDGSGRAAGMSLWLDGRPLEVEVVRDNLTRDIRHRREWGDASVGNQRLTLGARFRDTGFTRGHLARLTFHHRALAEPEIQALAAGDDAPADPAALWTAADPGQRADWLMQAGLTEAGDLHGELRAAREQLDGVVTSVREIMVMREMEEPRTVHLLERGEYDQPAEVVEPGTPEAVLPFPDDYPRNRLGLARWLTHPDQPLTARVTVNRYWQLFFGRGLVATPEDFGSQGDWPEHMELLDWLSAGFMDDWDVKALCRRIVLSATYRQHDRHDPAVMEADPGNVLLARGPRHRLGAEMLRDQALAASGLLVPRVGGPSVKPYQPDGLWEEVGPKATYHQDKGDGLYRRSLYTFWRRTAPPPSMIALDAPTREVCTVNRETTASPLQALVLLNDPQFFEAARVLAATLHEDHGDRLDDGLTELFHRLLARDPSAGERDRMEKLWVEQRDWHLQQPEAVARLLEVGEHRHPGHEDWTDQDRAAIAAWTMLAQVAMNHDDSLRP